MADMDDDVEMQAEEEEKARASKAAARGSKRKGVADDDDDEEKDGIDAEQEDLQDELKRIAAGDGSHSALKGGLWVEKYRPRKLDEVAYQDDAVRTLKRTLETGSLPHLLFYGPPGTGKTSTILAVARELYGPEMMRKRVLELNASNERGIDVIREKVKAFAQVAVSTKETVAGHPCPPFKIIILDEADSMTRDAQSALRRTMELYAKVTRFCIICNYVSRIIDPITSRCAKFRFKPLNSASITGRLTEIAKNERIEASDETLAALVSVAEGDMRKCITIMQSASRLVDKGETLTPELVFDVAGVVPPGRVDDLLAACKANAFSSLQTACSDCISAGINVSQLLVQLQQRIVDSADLTDVQKATISIKIAEADKKVIDGADESLQLLSVVSSVCTAMHGTDESILKTATAAS